MVTEWPLSLRIGTAIALVALGIVGVRILWPFLSPLALALLLTYMLVPLVSRIEENTGWSRTGATVFVYLFLLIFLIMLPVLVAPVIVGQVQALEPALQDAIVRLGENLSEVEATTILGQPVDPYQLYLQFADQLTGSVLSITTAIASSSLTIAFGVATTFFSTLLWLLFILVISFYIVRDSHNIARYFWGLVPRENRLEVYYLTRRIDRTWNAFLRGQLLLSTVIFSATTLVLMILGVPQALFLGIIAGILNLVPNLGPFLSGIPAVILALVQGSTRLEVSNLVFAVLVVISYTIIQQLESNFLVPRIIGGSVHLHPAVVLLGAIVGYSTVGILGIFLAAPTLASLRVIGGYAYRKLLHPDFEPGDVELPPEIAGIPDPRERPPVPVLSPRDVQPAEPLWRRWVERWRRKSLEG